MEEPQANIKDDYGFETKKAENWHNKQRTLLTCSRGILANERQLMRNLSILLPHSKKDSKLEKDELKPQLQDLCETRDCKNVLFFETRGKQLYLWLCKYPDGPSVYYQVNNVVGAEDHKLLGNCLKASRAFISFDENFAKTPHLSLQKAMLVDAFNLPKNHPKAQPFFDKTYSFSYNVMNDTIYFRNYQINKNGPKATDVELIEIGPRFDLQIIKAFDGFMGGKVIYTNQTYSSPKELRRRTRMLARADQFEKESKKKRKEIKLEEMKHRRKDSFDKYIEDSDDN